MDMAIHLCTMYLCVLILFNMNSITVDIYYYLLVLLHTALMMS